MYYLVKTLEMRPVTQKPVRVQVRIHRGSADAVLKNQHWEVWNTEKNNPRRWDEIVACAEGLEEVLAELRRFLDGRKA